CYGFWLGCHTHELSRVHFLPACVLSCGFSAWMDELNIIYHGLWRHESFLPLHYWRICRPDLRTIETTSLILDRGRRHPCTSGVMLYTVGRLQLSSLGGRACSATYLNALSKRVRSR